MRYLLLLLIFPFASFCVPEEGEFTVRIIQNGYEVKPVNGEIELEKKPFRIDVSLERLDGVYVYADFTDSLYKLQQGDSIPGMKDVPPNVMAEESFNKDRELLINREAWAYWFYDPKLDWYRFETVTKITYSRGEMYLGVKTVKQFYITENETAVPVENVDKPLYLFFFSADHKDGGHLDTELQRYKIRINWK